MQEIAAKFGRCEDPDCEDPDEESSLRWRDYILALGRGAWVCDGCWEHWQDCDDSANENFLDMD